VEQNMMPQFCKQEITTFKQDYLNKMEKNLFIPFKGIQDIYFGTHRNKIRKILGESYQNFRRGSSENTTDFYKDRGLFFEFDQNDLCNAIEFANYSNLFIDSKNILEFSYSELVEIYSKKSVNKDIEEGKGITFLDLGFGVTKIDNADKIETIIIFSGDYW
jgi:hypothetical protein